MSAKESHARAAWPRGIHGQLHGLPQLGSQSAGKPGPEIAGSSRELVEARVLHVAYPPGYTPKRKTNTMRAMPRLAAEIDNIVAFLAAAKKQEPEDQATGSQ
jgi:hypothetical protein